MTIPSVPDMGEEDLMTVQEVCDWLKVTRDWLYDQVEARQIPHIRLGRHIRFHPAQMRAYLQEHTVSSDGSRDALAAS